MPNKHNSTVFYSSTLEIPCVHKNWSSVPLIYFFLAKKIYKEQKPCPKILFKAPLQWYVHTTDMYEWSMSSIRYDCQFAFHYLQTAYFFENFSFVSPVSKKGISHEKRNPLQWNKAEAYYLHVYDSEHSYNKII